MTAFGQAYICGACGYDLCQQWDHGCDDRCMGCIEKARQEKDEKERQQALIFHCCNHCGRPQQECECPFDHGY